jgi:Flp pilus assembly CpaF family ATPase
LGTAVVTHSIQSEAISCGARLLRTAFGPAIARLLEKRAVEARKNILVAGGTSSCKTTLINALLAEVAKTSDRVVLIEDTREFQCKAPNLVALRTKDGVISLSESIVRWRECRQQCS